MVTRNLYIIQGEKLWEKTWRKEQRYYWQQWWRYLVTACGGGKTPDAPSDADLKKDVQEYITEVVDESAKISNFRVEDSGEGKNDTYEANCIVTYANDTMQYVDEFDLSYESKR